MMPDPNADAVRRSIAQRARLVDVVSLELAQIGVEPEEALSRAGWIADQAIELITGVRPSTVGKMEFATEADKTAVLLPPEIGRHLGDVCGSCIHWDASPVRLPHSLAADGTAYYHCASCGSHWTCWWDGQTVSEAIRGRQP